MNFFWDTFQPPMFSEMEERDASGKTTDLSQRTTNLTAKVKQLESSVEKLTLIDRALWEIIQENFHVSETVLKDKVNEIDLRDGILDGKLQKREVRQCSSCGRTLQKKHQTCLYCGAEDTQADIFDSV